MWKKFGFYVFAALFVFAGQFLASQGLVTGTRPPLPAATLSGIDPASRLTQGPALLYFWAEWCGICRAMQDNVDNVARDYPIVTVAVRSGDDAKVREHLQSEQLSWLTVNDPDGSLGQRYGIKGVPAAFFIDTNGQIRFASAGYTSEWGLRLRLWLLDL